MAEAVMIYKELVDSSKPFEFLSLRTNSPEPRPRKAKHQYYENFSRVTEDHDYVREFAEEEDRLLQKQVLQGHDFAKESSPNRGHTNGLWDVESTTSSVDLSDPKLLARKYSSSRPRINLTINLKHREISKLIKENAVVVVEGPTGCGKSTQVPQIVLDDSFKDNQPVNIVVTQPRKIAAFSVAKRICDERNCVLGSLVGYKVGLKSTISQDTRLTVCTTGVLLQHLVSKKHMNDFTHVILDEIHERDQELDFLMLLVRKFQRTVSRHVKVVLMSATFDSLKISNYFRFATSADIKCAPIVKVDTESQHNVDVYHIQEINALLGKDEVCSYSIANPIYSKQMMDVIVQLMSRLDEFECKRSVKRKGAVLVFLPGIHEIEDTYDALINFNEDRKFEWKIHVLHSSVTRDELLQAFQKVPASCRKILLSTNIAESAVTVADVTYVIDSCLVKQMETKLDTCTSCLALSWASKVNCKQRKGRVGRVASGTVYRLISKEFFMTLPNEQLPEMQRCPLAKLVLLAKLLDYGDPKCILALALDPPKLSNIEMTVLTLKETGGLLIENSKGRPDRNDGELTFLGKIMAKLPIDIHLAKLVVFGHILGVYQSSLIIASAMYVRNLLASSFHGKLESYLSKLSWANGSGSDCIAQLNAFKTLMSYKSSGFFNRNLPFVSEENWAGDNFIQLKYAREIADLAEELDLRLKSMGLVVNSKSVSHNLLSAEQEILLLKIAISGAFYPNYFQTYPSDDAGRDEDIVRFVGGFDPLSSVYFTNFPLDQPGKLYAKPVKKYLANCADAMNVTFNSSSKVYVQFGKAEDSFRLPTQVSLAVYKAVKLRQTTHKLKLDILPEEAARKRSAQLPKEPILNVAMRSIMDMRKICNIQPVLPALHTKTMKLKVTHIETPSKFFCQPQDVKTSLHLESLQSSLNDTAADFRTLCGQPQVDKVYVVNCKLKNQKFRARVVALLPCNSCEITLIDFGNTLIVSNKDLFDLGPALKVSGLVKIPQLAFECRLTNVGPIESAWSSEAIGLFSRSVKEGHCIAEIYSVVHSVVSVILTNISAKVLNDELVAKGYALKIPETFFSKENHRARENCTTLTPLEVSFHLKKQYKNDWVHEDDQELEEPKPSECIAEAKLRGPFSPLEAGVKHTTRSGLQMKISIERNSVNSVILGDDSSASRFLVAGLVQASHGKPNLTLHDTTLMPTIPGLLALTSMIFAPKIELRRQPGVKHFTGMICGLGTEKKNRNALYPEHDMEQVFDVEFTLEDMRDINRLRFWFNLALSSGKGEDKSINHISDIEMYQKQSQTLLLSLLSKSRNKVKPVMFNDAYNWRKVDKDQVLRFADSYLAKSNRIYPFHTAVLFESGDTRKFKNHKKEMEKLQQLSLMPTLRKRQVHCSICRVTLFTMDELRMHLTVEQHMQAWRDLLLHQGRSEII
ncbi:Hypothetical predicted protein [Cloeon dipterum]|uniref:Probable ATP-dependent RNA helicase spindle-E n=1 Tax=Cloeon dipterum TaxID=197152 RepID=A0A8S1C119_9INSE|nr:Hypothetical predicted protein [Cloeon dipterum]